jgi:hypothetical protein
MKDDYLKYLLPVGGLIFLVIFGKKVLEKIGLVDSKDDKNLESNLSNKYLTAEPFLEFRKKTGFKVPTYVEDSLINGFVKRLYDSKGFFNDDEDNVYSIFRSAQSKLQVSCFAYYFNQIKGRNLIEYLSSFLNSSEIARINEIIDKKPTNIEGFFKI